MWNNMIPVTGKMWSSLEIMPQDITTPTTSQEVWESSGSTATRVYSSISHSTRTPEWPWYYSFKPVKESEWDHSIGARFELNLSVISWILQAISWLAAYIDACGGYRLHSAYRSMFGMIILWRMALALTYFNPRARLTDQAAIKLRSTLSNPSLCCPTWIPIRAVQMLVVRAPYLREMLAWL